MSRKVILMLVVSLCAAGLALHFAMESLGGIEENFGGQMQETFDSHEEDQFVLSELGNGNPAQKRIYFPFASRLKINSRTLPPLLPPPKSI